MGFGSVELFAELQADELFADAASFWIFSVSSLMQPFMSKTGFFIACVPTPSAQGPVVLAFVELGVDGGSGPPPGGMGGICGGLKPYSSICCTHWSNFFLFASHCDCACLFTIEATCPVLIAPSSQKNSGQLPMSPPIVLLIQVSHFGGEAV